MKIKRIFIIDGVRKEAPAFLKETPQIGSQVEYNCISYRVTDVMYNFESGEVYIPIEQMFKTLDNINVYI
jgi:hypothetical protein